MNIDDVRTICVVGAGTMGSQIAQQFGLHGYSVWLMDADEAQLERALSSNRTRLQRRVEKGTLLPAELESALDLVRATTDLADAARAEVVIEAVVEDLSVKQSVFNLLERLVSADTILASNSSTIGISRIIEGHARPERCVNMHFFHPALVMRLVEIMRGPSTSEATMTLVADLAVRIGKEPVLIHREIYGLIVNRILAAIKRESFMLAEEGYAMPEDIDRAVKLGLNHPMGPFELTDFSGLDVFYKAALERYHETGDERDKPAAILEERVKAGHLGRKTGRGFFEYPDES